MLLNRVTSEAELDDNHHSSVNPKQSQMFNNIAFKDY